MCVCGHKKDSHAFDFGDTACELCSCRDYRQGSEPTPIDHYERAAALLELVQQEEDENAAIVPVWIAQAHVHALLAPIQQQKKEKEEEKKMQQRLEKKMQLCVNCEVPRWRHDSVCKEELYTEFKVVETGN